MLSDAAIKHSPRIGDRDEVFFVAGYGKVYNVWSVGAGRLARWTDAAHGVREISAPYRGELLLTTIEPDGDALRSYRLPGAPLETRPLESVTQAAETQVPAMELADRPYSPWSSLAPRWWFPTIELAEGGQARRHHIRPGRARPASVRRHGAIRIHPRRAARQPCLYLQRPAPSLP